MPDTKSSSAGAASNCLFVRQPGNIQTWSLLQEFKLGAQKSALKENEGYPQPPLRSLSFNTKEVVALVLGTVLGYSSCLQQGNGLKLFMLYLWTASMGNVAWKHCGTALVPSDGACDKLGGARRDRKDEPKR